MLIIYIGNYYFRKLGTYVISNCNTELTARITHFEERSTCFMNAMLKTKRKMKDEREFVYKVDKI